MFARLFVGGVTWAVALILFAALIQWSGSPSPRLNSSRDGVTALARSLNQLRPGDPGEFSWTVTRATSAMRGLVVEIDAVDPGDARRIAEHLVGGTRTQYDEVLVYVRARDIASDPLIRRIAWTPRGGYLASVF
ncbi:MAG: hypothetical protein ABL986_09240 [Vicinamibacterales bacterium]